MFPKLQFVYQNKHAISTNVNYEKGVNIMKIGVGTTGMCNLKCPHCYSRKFDGYFIGINDAKRILDLTDVESVNFGTGENILNPDFRAIIRLFHENNVKMSLTTNGYSVSQLEDEYLLMFNDIDFSLEFPDKERQDAFRGSGSWDSVINGLTKCKSLGIDTSIACAMMNCNAESIVDFRTLMNDFKSSLRINVIKHGEITHEHEKVYTLNYDTFWNTFAHLFNNFVLISCSEPILCVALGHDPEIKGSPCGQHAMRIQPDGSILPCVYWPNNAGSIRDTHFSPLEVMDSSEFKKVSTIPSFCSSCIYVDICRGGCAARRMLTGSIDSPDNFCPIVYGLDIPKLTATYSKKSFDLVHSTYLCTIIFGVEE